MDQDTKEIIKDTLKQFVFWPLYFIFIFIYLRIYGYVWNHYMVLPEIFYIDLFKPYGISSEVILGILLFFLSIVFISYISINRLLGFPKKLSIIFSFVLSLLILFIILSVILIFMFRISNS